MKRVYFTITGMNHYLGSKFLEPKMRVRLVKEPDNEHDREAIEVKVEGLGKVGYVANSPWTVLGDSMSAGRLYDHIGDEAEGKVRYVTEKGVVCSVRKADLIHWPLEDGTEKKRSRGLPGEEGEDEPEDGPDPAEHPAPTNGSAPAVPPAPRNAAFAPAARPAPRVIFDRKNLSIHVTA